MSHTRLSYLTTEEYQVLVVRECMQYTRDVYVNHVCIIHKSLSPCECEEPLNRIIRDMFPQTTFDPLELQKPSPSKVKTITYMLGTILLVITLMDKTGYTQLVKM